MDKQKIFLSGASFRVKFSVLFPMTRCFNSFPCVFWGLCYKDILLPRLWKIVTDLGPGCGIKGFLDILSQTPNNLNHMVFDLLQLSCDTSSHIITWECFFFFPFLEKKLIVALCTRFYIVSFNVLLLSLHVTLN